MACTHRGGTVGFVKLSGIPVWRPLECDPDSARPIGAVRAIEPVTLTRCVLDDQKRVQFGEEVEHVKLWRGRPLECRAVDTPPDRAVSFTTFECSTRRRELGGETVVISYRPYSLDWFSWATFKRVQKRSSGTRDQQFRNLLRFRDRSALWAAIQEMGNDLFGSEDEWY